jgi:hypothetical protein
MASPIDPALAKSLIKEFRDQNKASGEHALKAPEGSHLHGFFIDRETMEKVLADKDNAGMHVLLAKHPDFAGKDEKVNTILVTGSKLNTAPGAVTPYVSDGTVYCDYPICPPICTTTK